MPGGGLSGAVSQKSVRRNTKRAASVSYGI